MITADRWKSDTVMAAVISHSIKPSLLLLNAGVTLPLIFSFVSREQTQAGVGTKKSALTLPKHTKICVATPKLAQM